MQVASASLILLFLMASGAALAQVSHEYRRRVEAVRRTPGFVALWDFVKRSPDGRFDAHQRRAAGADADLRLDAANYVRDYWGEGRAATYEDFAMLGRGPFGDAVHFPKRDGDDFRPLLIIPRARLHDSGIDVKGPGQSVSMVAWIARQAGNHAIAGIWHEGTDLHAISSNVKKVEKGMRQYALFMGLAANSGASAAHVSENGGASFTDRYARNLSTTPEIIPTFANESQIDEAWSVVAFSFDNRRNTVTSYLNGVATDYWIENPASHPFFQWAAKGWRQAQTHKHPGAAISARGVAPSGGDPAFPRDQWYEPPETKPRSRKLPQRNPDGAAVELVEYEFTKVRETRRGAQILSRELVALRANPYWFPHDVYRPATVADGGPFTIGEVIHTSRSQGFMGYLGGIAVFDRALNAKEMKNLAALGRQPIRKE